MDIAHILVIISAFISLFGSYAYIKDTLKGKTKPNRVTWSMWALAPLIGTAAAISAGADIWGTVRIFLAGFIPLLVFIASFFNPNSFWKITPFDMACGALSLIALIFWLGVNAPVMAILLSAIGDGFAALPTIVKAWKYPETETGITFAMGLLSVLLVVPSIPVWNIENSAFQIYLIVVNVILVVAVYRKRLLRFL